MEDYKKFRVLVLMSTFNGEKYLAQQIDSILSQKDCNVSLLVRDDGSKDSTQEILNFYQEQGKLVWYNGENLRSAKSFIHLLVHADKRFDFYSFADQDDVWKNNKLSTAINGIGIQEIPTIWCSNSEIVDKNLNSLGENVNRFIPEYSLIGVLVGGGVQGATMVFNRALAKHFWNKEIPEKVTMHDYYVASVCLAIGGKIIYDKNSYMLYRQHDDNVLGIKKNLLSTINNRLSIALNKKNMFDISFIAKEIMTEYENIIPVQNKELLELVCNYKKSITNRIKLQKIQGIGNGRHNIRFFLRIGILAGKL